MSEAQTPVCWTIWCLKPVELQTHGELLELWRSNNSDLLHFLVGTIGQNDSCVGKTWNLLAKLGSLWLDDVGRH